MPNQSDFKKMFQALQLESPVGPNDAVYVDYFADLAKYHLTSDPILQLAQTIEFAANDENGALHLLSGQRSSGKSSELLRLKKQLEADGFEVWMTDLDNILNSTEPLDIPGFLLAAASELVKQLDSTRDLAKNNFLSGLASFFQQEVKIEGFQFEANLGLFKSKLDLSLKGSSELRQLLIARLQSQIDSIWHQVDVFISALAAKRGGKVAWIMDSLDRVIGQFNNTREVANSVTMMFSQHADKLRFKGVSTIAVVHPWLAASTGAALRADSWTFLPSIRVRQRNGEPDLNRLQILFDISLKRIPNLFDLIDLDKVRTLALASGGDLRGYFMLLRNAAVKAATKNKGEQAVEQAMVEQVISDARNQLLPISDDVRAWLAKIHRNKDAVLATHPDILELARLLNGKFVMNYRNGDDWYDVNPLLVDEVLKTPPVRDETGA
jgi:hypothetical protein